MNKIIFLDIDGVLVTRRSCIPSGKSMLMSKPDPCGANLLIELCIKNDAKIVISSTWRYNPKSLFELLKEAGIEDHFIFKCEQHAVDDNCWRTPLTKKKDDRHTIRGEEIKEWQDKHGHFWPKDRYVIFDDDSDFLVEQKPSLIQTTFEDGILIGHYRAAYEILRTS